MRTRAPRSSFRRRAADRSTRGPGPELPGASPPRRAPPGRPAGPQHADPGGSVPGLLHAQRAVLAPRAFRRIRRDGRRVAMAADPDRVGDHPRTRLAAAHRRARRVPACRRIGRADLSRHHRPLRRQRELAAPGTGVGPPAPGGYRAGLPAGRADLLRHPARLDARAVHPARVVYRQWRADRDPATGRLPLLKPALPPLTPESPSARASQLSGRRARDILREVAALFDAEWSAADKGSTARMVRHETSWAAGLAVRAVVCAPGKGERTWPHWWSVCRRRSRTRKVGSRCSPMVWPS